MQSLGVCEPCGHKAPQLKGSDIFTKIMKICLILVTGERGRGREGIPYGMGDNVTVIILIMLVNSDDSRVTYVTVFIA